MVFCPFLTWRWLYEMSFTLSDESLKYIKHLPVCLLCKYLTVHGIIFQGWPPPVNVERLFLCLLDVFVPTDTKLTCSVALYSHFLHCGWTLGLLLVLANNCTNTTITFMSDIISYSLLSSWNKANKVNKNQPWGYQNASVICSGCVGQKIQSGRICCRVCR